MVEVCHRPSKMVSEYIDDILVGSEFRNWHALTNGQAVINESLDSCIRGYMVVGELEFFPLLIVRILPGN